MQFFIYILCSMNVIVLSDLLWESISCPQVNQHLEHKWCAELILCIIVNCAVLHWLPAVQFFGNFDAIRKQLF